MKRQVFIFRGAPASGKGTVAPSFAESLPKPVVLIEQDKLRWGFHLIGRDITDISQEEHRLANQNTLLLYEQYLKADKYNIVVEGLFTWDDVDSSEGNVHELIDMGETYGYDVTSIVLMADKKVLLERNQAREYSVPPEEFDTLYHGVYETIDPSELVVDSTNDTTEQTLARLKEIVRR